MNSKLKPEHLKAAVYGANDGIITTFAVVAGVAGAKLSPQIVIILGIANMVADGVSMGIGDYLGENSEQRLRQIHNKSFSMDGIWQTGVITFLAFVAAGSLPLLPYFTQLFGFSIPTNLQFPLSILATAFALFLVGSLRSRLLKCSVIKCGLEMLSIGAIAATVAYTLGYFVDHLIN